jgi:uncharacterized membrane protein
VRAASGFQTPKLDTVCLETAIRRAQDIHYHCPGTNKTYGATFARRWCRWKQAGGQRRNVDKAGELDSSCNQMKLTNAQ